MQLEHSCDLYELEAEYQKLSSTIQNETFSKSFLLDITEFALTPAVEENETYNYTIQTGSYPQIIHEREFNATGGTITCNEFIDANGRKYDNWIPAIKLFSD